MFKPLRTSFSKAAIFPSSVKDCLQLPLCDLKLGRAEEQVILANEIFYYTSVL